MESQEKTCLTVCALCDGSCIARVRVKDNQIKEVSPVGKDDGVNSRLCVKGAALKSFVHAPERIDRPLRRVGEKGSGQFESISWEEAFKEIATRLTRIKNEDGAEAAAFYAGHPKWYRCALAALAADYGSPNYLTESSTCHTAPEIAYHLTYGCGVCHPDFKNCTTLICWGINPAASKGGSAGDSLKVKERGGKLIVVDPRKTPMSERADLHLALRPGTDGALALAMAHVILSNGWEDKTFLEQYAEGLEEYKALAAQMPPEKAAVICGVETDQIVEAAKLYATGGPAAIFTSSCGMAHSPNSVQNMRTVFLLEALTGNFGREGGNRAPGGWKLNGFHHAACPRVDVANEHAQGAFPVWNELIDNEGQALDLDLAMKEGRVRALIALGMNHRMFPQGDRMREGLLACEFYVDVDLYMTESAKCADIVLPAAAACERDSVHLLPGNQLLYLPRALEPGERRNDVEIVQGISAGLGLTGELTGMRSYDEYLDWVLKPSGVSLAELKGQGGRMSARREAAKKPDGLSFHTPSGKVEFKSAVVEKYADREGYDALPVYREYAEQNPDPEQFPLVLCVGGRRPWWFQSRTFHLPWLANLAPHPTVTLSVADAGRLGIEDGAQVRLTTPVGSRVLTAQVSTNIKEGVVFAVHDDEPNVNDIVDANYRDPISGFPGFRSYFCRVEQEVQV